MLIDIVNPQDIDIVQCLLDTVFIPPNRRHGLKLGHLTSIDIRPVFIV